MGLDEKMGDFKGENKKIEIRPLMVNKLFRV
jgi:hypothetical protein